MNTLATDQLRSRIPGHLRAELDYITKMLRTVQPIVAELVERIGRVDGEFHPEIHPSLADADGSGDLDPDVLEASGLRDEIDMLWFAIQLHANAHVTLEYSAEEMHENGIYGLGVDAWQSDADRWRALSARDLRSEIDTREFVVSWMRAILEGKPDEDAVT